jgi:hypothetical protein
MLSATRNGGCSMETYEPPRLIGTYSIDDLLADAASATGY